jgi:hypothetical protein
MNVCLFDTNRFSSVVSNLEDALLVTFWSSAALMDWKQKDNARNAKTPGDLSDLRTCLPVSVHGRTSSNCSRTRMTSSRVIVPSWTISSSASVRLGRASALLVIESLVYHRFFWQIKPPTSVFWPKEPPLIMHLSVGCVLCKINSGLCESLISHLVKLAIWTVAVR